MLHIAQSEQAQYSDDVRIIDCYIDGYSSESPPEVSPPRPRSRQFQVGTSKPRKHSCFTQYFRRHSKFSNSL